MPTVCEELCTVTKLDPPKPGESFADFAERLTKKVNGLPDKAWGTVSKAGQGWQNEAVTKLNEIRALKKEGKLDEAAAVELPELDGFEAQEAAEATPEAEAEADPPAKAATKPVKKAKAVKPTKAAKAKAASPKPAKAKANGTGKKGRPGVFADAAKIKIIAKENPHRKGSICHNYFAKYKDGMTVADAVGKGLPRANIRYLVGLGHLKVG